MERMKGGGGIGIILEGDAPATTPAK